MVVGPPAAGVVVGVVVDPLPPEDGDAAVESWLTNMRAVSVTDNSLPPLLPEALVPGLRPRLSTTRRRERASSLFTKSSTWKYPPVQVIEREM